MADAVKKLREAVEEETGQRHDDEDDREVREWHDIKFTLNRWEDVLDTINEAYRPTREVAVPSTNVPPGRAAVITFPETVRKVRLYNRTGGDVIRAYPPSQGTAAGWVLHNDTSKEDDVITEQVIIFNPTGTTITINDAATPTLVIEAGA